MKKVTILALLLIIGGIAYTQISKQAKEVIDLIDIPEPENLIETLKTIEYQETTADTQTSAEEKELLKNPQPCEQTELQTAQIVPKKRKITIKNGITDDMLTYKHWSGKHSPTTFSVTVNGSHIDRNDAIELEVEDQTETISVEWAYEFKKMGVHRTGSKVETVRIEPDKEEATIRFAWDRTQRIELQ